MSLKPLRLDEYTGPGTSGAKSRALPKPVTSMLIRLISRIGLDNIKKTVLADNKPMPSLLGDPRKRGFQDGKFEAVTLEALLSLEDNFDKLNGEELHSACYVSWTDEQQFTGSYQM
jgi:hypothetical protein